MVDRSVMRGLGVGRISETRTQKKLDPEPERASRPLVGFGVLIDNTIKRLTCLHEIMSRYLICGMI